MCQYLNFHVPGTSAAAIFFKWYLLFFGGQIYRYIPIYNTKQYLYRLRSTSSFTNLYIRSTCMYKSHLNSTADIKACVAQSAEHRATNLKVVSTSPSFCAWFKSAWNKYSNTFKVYFKSRNQTRVFSRSSFCMPYFFSLPCFVLGYPRTGYLRCVVRLMFVF